MTSRAIDQTSTTAITAATRTDQFGPPRVPRSGPLRPVASSASKTRRGSTGASAYRSAYVSSSGADVQAEDSGQGAQVAARVEVAAARQEVVDLQGLDDVRPDPGPLGELVDAQPQPLARGPQLRADHRVDDRDVGEVVDDDGRRHASARVRRSPWRPSASGPVDLALGGDLGPDRGRRLPRQRRRRRARDDDGHLGGVVLEGLDIASSRRGHDLDDVAPLPGQLGRGQRSGRRRRR